MPYRRYRWSPPEPCAGDQAIESSLTLEATVGVKGSRGRKGLAHRRSGMCRFPLHCRKHSALNRRVIVEQELLYRVGPWVAVLRGLHERGRQGLGPVLRFERIAVRLRFERAGECVQERQGEQR